MELTQLYYFYRVAKLEHISNAAKEINIAQPALTKSIHKLEEELGVPLFDHIGRNIKLTEWGKWLLSQIENPLISILDIGNQIEKLKNNKHIKICAKVASIFVTKAMLEFKNKHNEVTFSLLQNDNDGADIIIKTSNNGYKEKIYLVSGEYYKDKIKSISDLENIPLVTFTSNKELRSNIDSLLTKLNINPNISFECENLNSIHDLILSNNGIGFIPEFTSGELRKDLYLIDLPEIEVERYIDVKRIPYGIGNEEIVITFYNYLIECFKRKRIITL